MRYLTSLSLISALLLAYQQPSVRTPPTALIFADVTKSIQPNEIEDARQFVVNTVNSLATNTSVSVYPIHARMELPPALFHVDLKKPLTEQESTSLKSLLKTAYADEAGRSNAEPRTCIIRALAFAASVVRQERQLSKGPMQIFLISDMVEECKGTEPLGRAVGLTQPEDLMREIELLSKEKKNPHLDFGDATITVILPPRKPSDQERPDPLKLEAYWRKFFSSVASLASSRQLQWFPALTPNNFRIR